MGYVEDRAIPEADKVRRERPPVISWRVEFRWTTRRAEAWATQAYDHNKLFWGGEEKAPGARSSEEWRTKAYLTVRRGQTLRRATKQMGV